MGTKKFSSELTEVYGFKPEYYNSFYDSWAVDPTKVRVKTHLAFVTTTQRQKVANQELEDARWESVLTRKNRNTSNEITLWIKEFSKNKANTKPIPELLRKNPRYKSTTCCGLNIRLFGDQPLVPHTSIALWVRPIKAPEITGWEKIIDGTHTNIWVNTEDNIKPY